jgi:hypothetical protein
MPTFAKTMAGGKAISGGALSPRGRRGNTAQVAVYWAGGVELPPLTVQYLVIAGAGGGTNEISGGGGAGGYRTSEIGRAHV